MKRVYVSVEGQTEEVFVREVLQPALSAVVLIPVLVATKRVKSGGKVKGGLVSFSQVSDELRRLLSDSKVAAVTTLFDLYGLPDDFPGIQTPLRARERAAHLEANLHRALGSPERFIPHLSVHEFEAFLFVSPASATSVFNNAQQQRMNAVFKSYGGDVELINDGASTPFCANQSHRTWLRQGRRRVDRCPRNRLKRRDAVVPPFQRLGRSSRNSLKCCF